VGIDEDYLAKMMFKTRDDIYNLLSRLSKMKIAEYIPRKRSPMLILHEERLDSKNIRISAENFLWSKNRFTERMESMLSYAESETKCRSVQLLSYFGETTAFRCGQCDVCRSRNELNLSKYEFDVILEEIKSTLAQSSATVKDIVKQSETPEKILKVIRWLLDNGKISEKDGQIMWKN
jgi:ATP-dependent DNA helicase RecQ